MIQALLGICTQIPIKDLGSAASCRLFVGIAKLSSSLDEAMAVPSVYHKVFVCAEKCPTAKDNGSAGRREQACCASCL